jgi:hypothetical protein
LKYFAAGWWQTTADVLCSGSSWNSSLSVTPIRDASSSSSSFVWSSRFGQAELLPHALVPVLGERLGAFD